MDMMIKSWAKLSLLVAVFGMMLGWAGVSFAAKTISVTVMVSKNVVAKTHVFALGFSVNNKGRGGLGRRTTKTGPAGAKYMFGFKSTSGNVSCGNAVLTKDSNVILYYKGNKCVNAVSAKK